MTIVAKKHLDVSTIDNLLEILIAQTLVWHLENVTVDKMARIKIIKMIS